MGPTATKSYTYLFLANRCQLIKNFPKDKVNNQLVHSRFLTSGRTEEPAALFSHSSVPKVLWVCVGARARLFEGASTVPGGMDEMGAVAPSSEAKVGCEGAV